MVKDKNNFCMTIFIDFIIYNFSAVFMRVCSVTSLTELLWTAGVNDFVLKFISVIIKIGIILVPSHVLQHRKRVIFEYVHNLDYVLFYFFAQNIYRFSQKKV